MRKGYLLVEILVVLAVMAMVGGIFDRFWGTFAFDLPRDSRLIQENITLNNVVSHIRADVVSAKTLSESVNGPDEPNTLLMKMPNGVISYKFSNGRILRSFTRGTTGVTAGDMVWLVPHGWIEWQVWSKGTAGYAVEVRTCIEDKNFGQIRKKMANSNLFFAGALWGAAE
ncbi:MAG: hypothetical protein ABSB25_08015 [Sedimentisphaerales bacterium]|jgi:hypothetical protein